MTFQGKNKATLEMSSVMQLTIIIQIIVWINTTGVMMHTLERPRRESLQKISNSDGHGGLIAQKMNKSILPVGTDLRDNYNYN